MKRKLAAGPGADKIARPRLRVLLGESIAIGPGKAALLEAIARNGSISAAARANGMSYRRAWNMVDTMNKCFISPLVDTSAGGRHGGGACLTDLGREVLASYQAMEIKAASTLAREFKDFERFLAAPGQAASAG
ncbi:MAG TPA: LysR family transcriptional regulator [Thiobacillaceae bacterium]|nr:LysR family transcriptional regulator [Thiobacillaceae bacterium]HNU65441.1 LysR family transcriptional regulator [Thiobacillaceae bacterium]